MARLVVFGIAGGLTMGLTGLSTGLVTWLLGDAPVTHLIASAYIRSASSQSSSGAPNSSPKTPSTRLSSCPHGEKVFFQNAETVGRRLQRKLAGFYLFAALIVKTSAMNPSARDTLIGLGTAAVNHPFSEVFWSGVVAGWLSNT